MTQHIDLRGSSYISTPDVNLLGADTAHLQQSVGGWEEGAGATTAAPVQSTDLTPQFGDYHGKWTADAATSWIRSGDNLGEGLFPASPGTQYTAACDVAGVVAGGATIEIRIGWYDSTPNALGTSSVSQIAVPSDWTRISITATSPASTAWGAIQLIGRTATNGDVFYFDAVCAAEGSDATFVPSLRIVGDLDVRAKIAASLSAVETVHNMYAGGGARAFRLVPQTDGSFDFWYTLDGSSAIVRGSNVGVLTAGTDHEIRATRDTSDQVEFYVDDVGSGSVSGGSVGALSGAGGTPLYIGGRVPAASDYLTGKVYWAEVRDGIDGPVVARFDASTLTEADVVAAEVTQ